MMAEAEPDAYYQAPDNKKRSCILEELQIWLYQGYFTSDTPVALRRNDGSIDWRTVAEWIERNGRATPFCDWQISEEERKEDEEEVDRLCKELNDLRQRQISLGEVIREARARWDQFKKQRELIAQKFLDEAARLRSSCATQCEIGNGQAAITPNIPSKGSSSSLAPPDYPQIFPPPGVDPFALLKSCVDAKRKLDGSLPDRFRKLRVLFDRCDKKRLVVQTSSIFNATTDGRDMRMCTLCHVMFTSSNNIMEHLCSGKHLIAMGGSVCADAFDFWCKTVETVTKPSAAFARGPGPAFGKQPPPGFGNGPAAAPFQNGFGTTKPQGFRPRPEPSIAQREPSKRSAAGAKPIEPPDVPGLAIIRTRPQKVYRPCDRPQRELAIVQRKFIDCDKKKLDNDPETIDYFRKAPLLCMICNRCSIDKASNLVAHITASAHIDAIANEGHPVSQNAIDFWLRAVERACN